MTIAQTGWSLTLKPNVKLVPGCKSGAQEGPENVSRLLLVLVKTALHGAALMVPSPRSTTACQATTTEVPGLVTTTEAVYPVFQTDVVDVATLTAHPCCALHTEKRRSSGQRESDIRTPEDEGLLSAIYAQLKAAAA
jgi:hypothetical protein